MVKHVFNRRCDFCHRARHGRLSFSGGMLLLLLLSLFSVILTACAYMEARPAQAPPAAAPIINPESRSPTSTAQPATQLPTLVPQETAAPSTAVLTPTAVLLPSVTASPVTPSASTATVEPTPVPSLTTVPPTATEAAVRGGARVVREVLTDSVYCPMRGTHVRDEAQLLGRSAVCDLPISAYRVGSGPTNLVLVGGIHGGYEWNTVLLAESALKYLQENPEIVPSSLSVYVIPNANPDGLFGVTRRDGAFEPPETYEETLRGRFNGNDVDLNRNWDCNWQADARWGETTVSGGTEPFSEPETRALRDYFLELEPAAVLFWHSAATGVYPAGCGEIDPASVELARVFAGATEYDLYDSFDHYDVTGDAGDWLTLQGIPAITVELTTHDALDWEINQAGLKALLEYLAAEES